MWLELPGPDSTYHLRRLRSIRRHLGRDVTARLVSAFVNSRLGYCNSLLAHLPASTLAPLQRVLNAAARLVMDLKPREHVSPVLYDLHWLQISERINFKLCISVHHAINGRSPSYLTELVTSVVDIPGRAKLRSVAKQDLFVSEQDWSIEKERCLLLDRRHGTNCLSSDSQQRETF